MRRLSLLLCVLALSVGCDQATKWVATATLQGAPPRSYFHDLLRTTYVTNPGAFLSLGGTLSEPTRFWLLTVAVGAGLAALLAYVLTSRRLTAIQVVGLGLVASGGLSNWIDRARNAGRVVDFLNLGIGPVRTGIFNVADVAIFAGATLLVFFARERPSLPPPAPRGSVST